MTTTPELSREQRDAATVDRYSDGETLDAIGQSFGPTRGRVRQIIGLVKFTEAEYAAAARDFRSAMDASGLKPTIERYDAWTKTESLAQRSRPSGISVRNCYGTWLDAVRFGQE